MSQSEDDDYAYFGTPLEQFDEENVPRKKPVTVQDQIATDKHGRRRFHGAFTGGFSAGFFNSVGSLEGWAPSTFKSSRNYKAETKFQKPEDFMDDEDLEEFGIAPTVVRAKPEYSGKAQKRERVQFFDGPIPGEPVLKSILQPVRETMGVLLLMKMGWKPGQGIGPRLTKLQKKKEKQKNKVYGCSMPGKSIDSEDDEDVTDPNLLFAPEEHEVHFLNPKTNTFGLDYSGLDKTSILSMNSTLKSDTFRLYDNNKKLAIKGQAFGVGAFEDEDDDIYAKEDMSQYDFALDTASSLRLRRRNEREAEKLLAIAGANSDLEGFVKASNAVTAKKVFPPPVLPQDFKPFYHKKKTRFDAPIAKETSEVKIGKHFITAEDRNAILGDERPMNITKDKKPNEDIEKLEASNTFEGFRPFISDPEKQLRYEKYLHFIKIGAKDAFPAIQPKFMSEWEKEREINEFEQAARLYKPLSGMMAEKFAHGELPDDSANPLAEIPRTLIGEDVEMIEAAKSKMFGKLTRRITDWAPCILLCKRMNIADPDGGNITMSQVVSNKLVSRSKFSVFNFLDVKNKNLPDGDKAVKQDDAPPEVVNLEEQDDTDKNNSLSLEKPIIDFEEPLEKRDLFKAIFCSDEESDTNDQPDDIEEDNLSTNPPLTTQKQTLTVANALRNTSPPKGIFANLDLDALNKRKTVNPLSLVPEGIQKKVNPDEINEPVHYGPSLPTKPYFLKSNDNKSIKSSSESHSEEEWVERKEIKEKKKHKKHKKSKIKKKHKDKYRKKER